MPDRVQMPLISFTNGYFWNFAIVERMASKGDNWKKYSFKMKSDDETVQWVSEVGPVLHWRSTWLFPEEQKSSNDGSWGGKYFFHRGSDFLRGTRQFWKQHLVFHLTISQWP